MATRTDAPFDVAVIGRGMIGSAAARHAAKSGWRVALIGPPEVSKPSSKAALDGDKLLMREWNEREIYGAHYDEGRITRKTDRDPVWAELASRSIDRYGEIFQEAEATSGNDEQENNDGGGGIDSVPFYVECGHLAVGPKGSEMMENRINNAQRMDVKHERLGAKELKTRFPMLHFPEGCEGIFEPCNAGYISARGLVDAQTRAAQRFGARVIPEVAAAVTQEGKGSYERTFYVRMESGKEIRASRILVAAGAFCNARPLLPDVLDLTPLKSQTVHFVLTEEDASTLEGIPTIIFENESMWAYLLPPIRYPDGTVRLKLGGQRMTEEEGKEIRKLQSEEDLVKWYRSGGDPVALQEMASILRSFVPGINPSIVLSDACVTLDTTTGHPYVGEVRPGLAVATGGNGVAAKSSDEIGRLGAVCLADKTEWENERIAGHKATSILCPRTLS